MAQARLGQAGDMGCRIMYVTGRLLYERHTRWQHGLPDVFRTPHGTPRTHPSCVGVVLQGQDPYERLAFADGIPVRLRLRP
jgi:hypothetical protein